MKDELNTIRTRARKGYKHAYTQAPHPRSQQAHKSSPVTVIMGSIVCGTLFMLFVVHGLGALTR
ncbi:hypothetical protein H1O16_gp034 [Burkholderia phage BcepSaruman]|uniref:Uncharacterized protein n=1 Tax=Burkholderia phage BcepSaruman TaxID=2530032 RepID=A0A4D5ZDX0_9CAUD|nr:hypothetical protein H1O16_gp034 [Burkholderia phage BcepSaruman]QBX06447.1 hypothetical protein BcepSaruman_034 [Burkholderia phage BcepSaruman]